MSARATFHPLRVEGIEAITDDSVALTFEVPEELRADYTWTAGQHLTIRGPDEVRRSYSICTPPSTGILRVGVKRLPGGVFSEEVVDDLEVGDTLDVMTPAGRFTPHLDPTTTKSYAAIAAGSGITPMLSIVATLLEAQPGCHVTLVYANRSHDSVMFLDEIHDLKDRFLSRFRILHVLSREKQEADLLSGRLDGGRLRSLSETVLPIREVDEWFLCGPLQMVTELSDVLRSEGAGTIHTELFHADAPRRRANTGTGAPAGSATAPGADTAKVTIRLDGRTSGFSLPHEGVPVLEAALAVRADAPYACRGGVCGTCRAKVVRGEVEMETNWALEPDEVAQGYVLTCQAHPLSPSVELDYDA